MSISTRVAGADGQLVAIPAVHYRMAFAHIVRQTIQDDETRPNAVAVELGPQATAIISSWIRELGPTERLPCMLGLLRRNRLIHPRHRQACLALQERYRVPLHRVPVGELLRNCGFSPTSLICLSAVDSMIEAIRSAVEHGLDIYGIDLEESASGDRQQVLLEDPTIVESGFEAYVERNARHCANYRDDYVDSRREWQMAAQLRFLASNYRRVLFTGGLAHWSALKDLLELPTPPAMAPMAVSKDDRYTKVIVDPNLAICQMDVMPNCTSHYEDLRAADASRLTFPDPMDFLQHAYQRVMKNGRGELIDAHSRLAHYFAFLENLLMLRQRHTVDLATALEAAAAIVSPEMACRLQKTMLANARIQWLRAGSTPKLPYLQALATEIDEQGLVEQCSKVRLVRGRRKSDPFLVSSAANEDLSSTRRALCLTAGPHGPSVWDNKEKGTNDTRDKQEKEKNDDNDNTSGSYGWIWPPCEHVFYGTAYRLMSAVSEQIRRRDSEPFNGSLQGGINIKATLRAAAHGDNDIHVHVSRRQRESGREDLQQPFVYVFQEPQRHRSDDFLNWHPLHAGYLSSKEFVGRAVTRYTQVVERFGNFFIGSVLYDETRPLGRDAQACSNVNDQRLIWGGVAYGNPVLNNRQAAQWLTDRDFSCCPVIQSPSMRSLLEYFERELGVSLDLHNWPDTLVRLAIPFAKVRVLIVAPNRDLITDQAQSEARKRGIRLDFVPLSYLSIPLVREIRTQWHVSSVDAAGTEWPDDVTRLLGPADAHFDLLPPSIRQQAIPNG